VALGAFFFCIVLSGVEFEYGARDKTRFERHTKIIKTSGRRRTLHSSAMTAEENKEPSAPSTEPSVEHSTEEHPSEEHPSEKHPSESEPSASRKKFSNIPKVPKWTLQKKLLLLFHVFVCWLMSIKCVLHLQLASDLCVFLLKIRWAPTRSLTSLQNKCGNSNALFESKALFAARALATFIILSAFAETI